MKSLIIVLIVLMTNNVFSQTSSLSSLDPWSIPTASPTSAYINMFGGLNRTVVVAPVYTDLRNNVRINSSVAPVYTPPVNVFIQNFNLSPSTFLQTQPIHLPTQNTIIYRWER